MKVVLVAPQSTRPILGGKESGPTLDPPLGLLQLAAEIRHLADPVVIDCQLNRLSPDEAATVILRERPDLVGFSVNFVSLLKNARKIAQSIRKQAPELPIVFGGNFATFVSDRLIRKRWVDAIVLREGDTSFPRLLQELREHGSLSPIQGTVVKEHGRPRRVEFTDYVRDLDSLPFAAYDLLHQPERYLFSVATSRGCPYDCIYCSTKRMWGAWRCRSAGNVLREIDNLLPLLPRKRLNFCDDNFTVSRKRVYEFVEGLKERGNPITWGTSARLETVDAPMLEALGAAGCRNIFFGFESGSPRILDKLNRHYSPEQIERTVDTCIAAGIIPHASFMIGLPWETRDDVEATLALIERINTPFLLLNLLTPFPGTPIYDAAEHYGLDLLDHDSEEQGQIDMAAVFHQTGSLTAEEIRELWIEGTGLVVSRHAEREAYENRVVQGGDR